MSHAKPLESSGSVDACLTRQICTVARARELSIAELLSRTMPTFDGFSISTDMLQ